MSKNSLDQPARKPQLAKKRKSSSSTRQREPTAGSFKPGDPRINYKGRPPDLVGYRQKLREVGEEKALNYLLECMELGKDPENPEAPAKKPTFLGLSAACEWLHQARGKPRQQIALTGMDDGPVQVAEGLDLKKLSVAKLKQLRELVKEAQRDPAPVH